VKVRYSMLCTQSSQPGLRRNSGAPADSPMKFTSGLITSPYGKLDESAESARDLASGFLIRLSPN